ncbi:hypothetical protein GA830_05175 [Mesorhizobium sp. NBSH29]|uniref:hypothetical protein n=1 Tax=Mesorhizobium sp. NBSH29 TaxID=2654249 RepID=UPI0018966E4B|nr:hypothetical protein [Mesorhizobium sp. NBSH29]QPC86200.1 hypothetical protein GA830_05175 [Mesorhizobium sp. NBSH29]
MLEANGSGAMIPVSFTDFTDGYGDWEAIRGSSGFIEDGVFHGSDNAPGSHSNDLMFTVPPSGPANFYVFTFSYKAPTPFDHFFSMEMKEPFDNRFPARADFTTLSCIIPTKADAVIQLITGSRKGAAPGRLMIDWIRVDPWVEPSRA